MRLGLHLKKDRDLWCRRFAYCDTNRFGKMASMPEYGDFPALPRLNEDNVVGDEAKFSRRAFKANDPTVTMDCPPWWRVYIDGYGGQNSLGGESYEGAVGSYLFVCCSTGSTDAGCMPSHEQFPVALHQFLRRVESEHFKVQMIYVRHIFSKYIRGCRGSVCFIWCYFSTCVGRHSPRNGLCRVHGESNKEDVDSDAGWSSAFTCRFLGVCGQVCCIPSRLTASIYKQWSLPVLS